jgi:hypothetical protein
VHRAIWPALFVVVTLGLTCALVLRPPPKVEPPAAVEDPR